MSESESELQVVVLADRPEVAPVPTHGTINQLYMSQLCLHMKVYDAYITRIYRDVNVY